MKLKISAGTGALRAANSIFAENQAVPARFSVEGSFLVLDARGLDEQETLAEMGSIDAYFGSLIADLDNEKAIADMSELKAVYASLARDVNREYTIRARNAELAAAAAEATVNISDLSVTGDLASSDDAEATDAQVGSHPTSTGDESISIAPQQSGNSNEEMNDGIEEEQEQRPRRKR